MGGWWIFDSFFLSYSAVFLLLIFGGAITKRAQIPFSAWLPAAMAAPTPVSSLVHSSTLVTAGVYILIRFNFLFRFLNLSFFKTFSLFTILLAGGCAWVEKDFKKIVAMSTLSQLGIIIFILCVGSWVLAFLHMVIHAFFKSMLFLSTGSLMGQMGGTQDSRFYGGRYINYRSFLYFLVRCLCLSGFPFFVGFYSKDFIISSSSFFNGILFYGLFLLGCIATVGYSFRVIRVAYFYLLGTFCFSVAKESFLFFLSVQCLFFCGWFLGGLFYWFFLSQLRFFLLGFDLLFGIFLLFGGIFFYNLLILRYKVFVILSLIGYLRWVRSFGSSFFLKGFVINKVEGSWIEVLGGRGVYHILRSGRVYINIFEKIRVGRLVVFVTFSSFLFYFFS